MGLLRRLLTAPCGADGRCGARRVTHPRGFATGRGLGNSTGLAGVGAWGGGEEYLLCPFCCGIGVFVIATERSEIQEMQVERNPAGFFSSPFLFA